MSMRDVAVVDDVMMFLGNRKRLAVEKMFGHATQGYQHSWLVMNPFEFWCRLDLSHKRELVEMARRFYAKPEQP